MSADVNVEEDVFTHRVVDVRISCVRFNWCVPSASVVSEHSKHSK